MNLPGFTDPVSLIGSPMKFSRTKVDYRLPPPRVGEHTEQILHEYGFSKKQISNLHDTGAIDNAKFEIASPTRPLAKKKKRKAVLVDDDEDVGKQWDMLRSVSVPVLADAEGKDQPQSGARAQI